MNSKHSNLSINSSTEQTDTLIEARNLGHYFGDNRVLHNISLQLKRKEIVTLIGPNGAGKSTLLKILLGLIKPTEGQVSHKPALEIGFMPQKIQIDPSLPMTVQRFLELGFQAKPHSILSWFKSFSRMKRNSPLGANLNLFSLIQKAKHNTTMFAQTIAELDIEHLLPLPIQKVSGGEMQRILLARALIKNPDLLVLDEPVQGVDLQGQTELYQYIEKIRHQRGCSILMVSHDLHLVMRHTDMVLCLNQHLCCSGHPQTVSQSTEFQSLFENFSDHLAFYEHQHNHDACELEHGEHGHEHSHDCQEKHK